MPHDRPSSSGVRRKPPKSERSLTLKRILVVEDETEIGELIEFHLGREGLPTHRVENGRLALESIREVRPDLVILDLMLPDIGGLDICRRLKSDPDTAGIPVVMVTAKAEDDDVVIGLELGADDYVLKPFSPKVLVARVKGVLRRKNLDPRTATGDADRLHLAEGRLRIDRRRHEVTVDEQVVEFTVTEFGILARLGSRPGAVLTRNQIISAVHGRDTILSSRTVDVHVTAVRRKLGELGRCIETVRGVGYRFADTLETSA